MEHFTTTGSAARRASGCIIVGLYKRGKFGVAASDVDSAGGGALRKLVRSGDLSGEIGSCTILPGISGVRAQRIAVVGLGSADSLGPEQYRRAIAAAASAIKKTRATDIVNYLSLESVGDANAYYLARYTVETIHDCLYSFTEMKSGRKPRKPALRKIGQAITSRSDAKKAAKGAEHAEAISEGKNVCKHLGNLPANVCTPSYVGRLAQKQARKYAKLETKVLNEAACRKLGMHSFLSVTAGSAEPAKFVVMNYRGGGGERPIVLVGKGVTFDTGGISIKPGPGMDEMKFDMCGAASVIGTMVAIAKMKLKINVTVIVPACDNMPGQNATRPGDIVKSMSGQTIEILNTDAEGRLILCDALTYSRRFKPSLVIDVATLTGACVIALGHHRAAIMSRSSELRDEIAAAGEAADDLAWPMPLDDAYGQSLKSNFADFANVGSRSGGSIIAGHFLSRFTEGLNWAHLDIAGVAWHGGARKGATGRPVPLLTELILDRAGETG